MAKIILNVDLNAAPAQKELKALENAIKGIADTLSNVKADKNLTAQINALTKNYTALANAAQKVTKTNNQNAISEEKLAREKEKTRKATAQANLSEEKLNQTRKKATVETEKQTTATKKNTDAQIQSNSAFLKSQIRLAAYSTAVNLLKSAFTSLNQTLVQTEDAVIALQRVLPEGSATDSQIADDLYNMAQSYGQAFDGVQQATQNFAKAGLDYEDSLKATEAALVAVNVAELDVTQATEGMIAIMTQFGYTANDLMDIVDMLNKVGDQYAVSSDKLLTALQRTGSTAANANLSLEETIGLVTALSEATGRSGENIGTAVNSLIQYTRKASSLDVFAQLSDGAAQAVEDFRLGGADILDIWREVATSISSMSAEQENLLNEWLATDEMQSLTQELHDELGDIFETTQQVYGTANTYRQNYFIALLKNMDTVMEATQTAQNAQGYSQAENEKYMQTYTAQVTALTAQWQHLVSEEQGFLDFKKYLVSIGSTVLDVIELFGGLRNAIFTVSAALFTVFGAKMIASITNFFKTIDLTLTTSKIGLVLTSISIVLGGINAVVNLITKSFEEEKEAAKEAADESTEALNETKNNIEILEDFRKSIDNTNESIESLTNSLIEQAKQIGYTTSEVNAIIKKYEQMGYSAKEAIELSSQELLIEEYDQKRNDAKDNVDNLKKSYELELDINQIEGERKKDREKEIDFLKEKLDLLNQAKYESDLLTEKYTLKKEDRGIIPENAIIGFGVDTVVYQPKEDSDAYEKWNKFYEDYNSIINKTEKGERVLFEDIDNVYKHGIEYLAYLDETGQNIDKTYDHVEEIIDYIRNTGYIQITVAVDEQTLSDMQYRVNKYLFNRTLNGNPIDTIEEYIAYQEQVEQQWENGKYTDEQYSAYLTVLTGLFPEYANAVSQGIETTEEFDGMASTVITKLDDLSDKLSVTSDAFNEFSNNGFIGYDTLSKIREQYGEVIPDLENYINELARGDITSQEVEKTLSDLTMAYIENTISSETMAASNVNVIAALLKEQGVLNAVESATLLVNQAKAELAAQNVDNYESFLGQAYIYGLTREQLAALLVQEQIYNNTELSTDDKIAKFNKIANAAGLSAFAISLTNEELEQLSEEEKNNRLNERVQSFLDAYGQIINFDFTNSGSVGSANQTDEYLENLKEIVELRQSELSLLEKQDRPISEQIAKQYEIKAALQDELNYLISIGADQVEINNLRGQLLDIDTAIVDLRKQEYENRRSYLENELSLMEAQDKNYQEQTAKIREIQEVLHLYADYLRSIGASQEDINDLSMDWLDYMEQIQQLQIDNYESERSLLESEIAIRKNQASIDEIISMYQKVQDLLHQQAEYLRLIGAEQEEINNLSSEWYNIQQDIESLKEDALQNALEAATKPIEEEINLREEAKRKEEEQLDIEEKKKAVLEAQKKLLDTMAQRNVRVYNTATGQWEWQSNAQDIQDAKEELENAQKEYDDAIYDEQTNLLQEQVDWAEKIYEKIQDGDATNEEIVELMKFFSNQWSDSDEEGKKFLHDANIVLGSIIGATYDDATGTWTNSSGHAIFSEIGSAISANKNEDGTWLPIDFTKVRDTIGNFDVEKLMRQYEIEKNHLVNPMQYIQSFNNGRTYNNSGNTTTTSYSLNGVTIPQNASKELAEVLTKIFDDMKLYGN